MVTRTEPESIFIYFLKVFSRVLCFLIIHLLWFVVIINRTRHDLENCSSLKVLLCSIWSDYEGCRFAIRSGSVTDLFSTGVRIYMSSCFSDYAVKIVDTSCSSYANNVCTSPNMTPSVQKAVTNFYKLTLSNMKQLLVEVSWNKCQPNQGLSITFNNSAMPSFKLNTNSGVFRKLKGSKTVESDNFKIEIFWDLSMCKYHSGSGSEPVNGYYVIVTVDSEVGLVLGDLGEEAAKRKFTKSKRKAKSSLTLRREYFSGNTLYSTKAKFSDAGALHEISIRCSGEEWVKHPFLSICIDKKVVIRVKRLDWNFRGNQTLFLEGMLIDLLWDVHDWFFSPFTGSGIFMFRRRSGMDKRMWLEETVGMKSNKGDFSLLIYACKSI